MAVETESPIFDNIDQIACILVIKYSWGSEEIQQKVGSNGTGSFADCSQAKYRDYG